MSTPKEPDQAKLVISLLRNDKQILDEVLPVVEESFGALDMLSPWFDFQFTSYYEKEMGAPLFRRMAVYKDLIRQDQLAAAKVFTNTIEKRWQNKSRRSLNIDPGYLLLSRFILATGKDFSHRIYLDQGIYGDLTLLYQGGGFKSLAWTYPDYAGEEMTGFLTQIRKKYVLDLQERIVA